MKSVVLSGAVGIVLSGAALSCYQVPGRLPSDCCSNKNRFRNFYNEKSYGFLITRRHTRCLWITQTRFKDEDLVIISSVSQKDGAGKTTLALHVASQLSRIGARATVIDVDPQGFHPWSGTGAGLQGGVFDRISEAL